MTEQLEFEQQRLPMTRYGWSVDRGPRWGRRWWAEGVNLEMHDGGMFIFDDWRVVHASGIYAVWDKGLSLD